MATGHMLGDTGNFSNTIYTGFQVPSVNKTVTPFLESDPVLGDVDEHFSGNFLNEATILQTRPRPGLQHRRDRQGRPDLDLRSHRPHRHADHHRRRRDRQSQRHSAVGRDGRAPQGGKPAACAAAAPGACANYAGTTVANVVQQDYFAAVVTRAILPDVQRARQAVRFGVLVARSRRHPALSRATASIRSSPGINGPTSLAAIRNADDDLARIRAALGELGLLRRRPTSSSSPITAFRRSPRKARPARRRGRKFADTPAGHLPLGFVALDLAACARSAADRS